MPPRKKQRRVDSSKKDNSESDSTDYEFWLIKSEPDNRFENGVNVKFSIDDLEQQPNQTSPWEGVRNFQARNFMRDNMKVGHKAFFYHSNCKVPGIVGVVEVVKESYPDHTQFDKASPYYDNKHDCPRWFMVDFKLVRKLKRLISLSELKQIHQDHKLKDGPLKNMFLFTRGRLSVQPVTKDEWDFIMTLEDTAELEHD